MLKQEHINTDHIKNINNKLHWLRLLFSPFKFPYIKLYIGRTNVGVPFNIPNNIISYDSCSLGWKVKFGCPRYEWCPRYSLVFFGFQIAIIIVGDKNNFDIYWEAWIFYQLFTANNLSKKERIDICKQEFKLTYSYYNNFNSINPEIINYYERILKPKYL